MSKNTHTMPKELFDELNINLIDSIFLINEHRFSSYEHYKDVMTKTIKSLIEHQIFKDELGIEDEKINVPNLHKKYFIIPEELYNKIYNYKRGIE